MKTTLRVLLVLMIIMSVVINIDFMETSNSLYGAEFTAPYNMILHGQMPTIQIVEWLALLLTHCVMLSLPFLVSSPRFRKLLIYIPLLFIIIYIFFASVFIIVLLFPFIIFWVIALIVAKYGKPQKGVLSE